jgi:uridine kinase
VTFPIIALSGPPGVGKSTVIEKLVGAMGLNAVYFDAHETMTDRPVAEIEDWLARGMPLDEVVPPALVTHLIAASRERTVLFETPLGRAVPEHSRLISRSIWLDCPADIALARKIGATLADGEWASLTDLTGWLTGYLAAYPRIIAPSLAEQTLRVRPLADDLVDATCTPLAVADRVRTLIEQTQQRHSV